jgi:hypothetical protein
MEESKRFILMTVPPRTGAEPTHDHCVYDRVARRGVEGPMPHEAAREAARRLNMGVEQPACYVQLAMVPNTSLTFPADVHSLRPIVEVRVPRENSRRTVMAVAYQLAARIEALSPAGAAWAILVERRGDHDARVVLNLAARDQEGGYDALAVLRDAVCWEGA